MNLHLLTLTLKPNTYKPIIKPSPTPTPGPTSTPRFYNSRVKKSNGQTQVNSSFHLPRLTSRPSPSPHLHFCFTQPSPQKHHLSPLPNTTYPPLLTKPYLTHPTWNSTQTSFPAKTDYRALINQTLIGR